MLCLAGILFFGGVKATIVAKGILRLKFKSILFCTTTDYFLPFSFPKKRGKKKRRMN